MKKFKLKNIIFHIYKLKEGYFMAKIVEFKELKTKKEYRDIANMKLTKEQIMASSERLSYDDDSDLQDFYKKLLEKTKEM